MSQNSRIILGMWKAHTAVQCLRQHGITVLKVEVEHTRPILWVQPSERCVVLEAEEMHIRSGTSRPQRVMLAKVGGCRVQWPVRGD
jgi:hypothetical protein